MSLHASYATIVSKLQDRNTLIVQVVGSNGIAKGILEVEEASIERRSVLSGLLNQVWVAEAVGTVGTTAGLRGTRRY